MDLQIDVCNGINEKEWNSAVYNSKHGSIFHTFEWVDALEKEFGRKILIGAWLNGKLVGVFPCIIGSKYKPTKHIRSFRLGFDYGGPVSTVDDRQIIMELILKFEEIAKKEAYKATISVLKWDFLSELEALGYNVSLGKTFLVDLKKPVDELWNKLEKSARYDVRKAIKSGLTVRLADKRLDIEKYYELFVDTANRAGFGPDSRSKTFYYDIWDKLHEKGLVKIFFTEFNNEVIAGTLCLLYKKTIIEFDAATLSEYRSYQPHSLLNWHVIEWGHQNGFEGLDLAGADLSNLYQFKKKWGGELNDYYVFTKTYPSLKYRLLQAYYGIRRPLYKLKKRFVKNEVY
ncbi:MAG: lipid II:glycine glycyltransferase FemX [Promethearchaeota archaeon]